MNLPLFPSLPWGRAGALQACYGILKVPEGSWLCRTCALGVQPKCLLCPKKGGAMKPTRSGTKWVHVSCALWIPEVGVHGLKGLGLGVLALVGLGEGHSSIGQVVADKDKDTCEVVPAAPLP